MAERCYSPPGCHFGVGEAAVVALVPGVHPGLRLPDGDPPGAPHVPGQLAHGEHGRCVRAGEAQRGCGDLGPGSAEGPGPTGPTSLKGRCLKAIWRYMTLSEILGS